MSERKSIVLIGAGSASFTRGLLADMIMSGRPWEIRLCDIDAGGLETARGLCARMLEARPADIVLRESTDRRDLLRDADVVVTTVQAGGRRGWEHDVFIPRRHGIYQPVGDSVMPGGISRTLRHVPIVVGVARDIAELCPDALFVNYSNPMSANCRAVRQATGVPVIGLCHGVIAVERHLAEFAGFPKGEGRSLAVGLNHLTWFLGFMRGSADAWPAIHRALRTQGRDIDFSMPASAFPPPSGLTQPTDDPFSWELFGAYGSFPAVQDRHVIEFFPALCREHAYYGLTPGVDAFSFERVVRGGDDWYQSMYEQSRGTRQLDMSWVNRIKGEHEQLLDILASRWDDRPAVYSINLPNEGQVENLPRDAILESPCLVDGSGFHPLSMGRIPEGIAGLLQRRISCQQLSVDAALTGDRRLVVQALIADGAVTEPVKAARLADELIEAHRPYLPQFAGPA